MLVEGPMGEHQLYAVVDVSPPAQLSTSGAGPSDAIGAAVALTLDPTQNYVYAASGSRVSKPTKYKFPLIHLSVMNEQCRQFATDDL